jgi:cyclopropane-fatty-acyl-phospholipid synthase
MDKGHMHIELPGGKQLVIGNDNDAVDSANIRIRDNAFYKRCILYGDIGFGEAYADGLWDTDDIAGVISWVLLNRDKAPGISGNKTDSLWLNRADHYDMNNDFFRLFLDPTMTWSAAYFQKDGMDLEEAQLAKYKRLCEQLKLSPTDHVLEIGSGWGGNAIYMAKNYGCRVTSVTISKEQYQLASRRVKAAGLEQQVNIQLQDYRTLSGSFDKIVSVEMLEAVGHRYLDTYFQKCHALLKQEGILALQVITCPDCRYDSGSLLPSVGAINAAVNRTGEMTLVDLKEMGLHYAATLKLWFMQFNSRQKDIKRLGFDDRFIRKWNYYLCYCEAAFRMRNIYVMQLVYTRPNNWRL